MSEAAPLILVADDIAENRALAQATLEDEDYRVILANDGLEAIAAVTREKPDCIVMDIRMPKLDGIAAAEQIRALPEGKDVAIIFVTAQRDVATFDRALAVGGDDFMTKPYRPDELIVRVQTAMRMRKLATGLVAELKLQRDHLQRLELQKEQLVAFLVHDFKNPVYAIDLQTQAISRNANDAERVRKCATKIKDEARTLLGMITNLLDISKGDEGSLAPARRAIDVHDLVQHAIDELGIRAAAATVRVHAHVSATVLHADPDLMKRVLVNLIDNAIRHSPEDSDVRVSVEERDDGVELAVADAGRGIAVEQRDQVFERFQSAGGATNRGLGLAFCKVAVEAHGGRIWVEDAAPGAVFRVRIPR
jgi:signal transduction histidine kinase